MSNFDEKDAFPKKYVASLDEDEVKKYLLELWQKRQNKHCDNDTVNRVSVENDALIGTFVLSMLNSL